MNIANPELVKKVFLSDAAFSFLVGLDLILFSDLVAQLLGGFSTQVYFVFGVVFVAWSVDLLLVGIKLALQQRFAQWVVYVDWAFAGLTMLVLVLMFSEFTLLGTVVMALAAFVVSGIAWFKQKGIGGQGQYTVA